MMAMPSVGMAARWMGAGCSRGLSAGLAWIAAVIPAATAIASPQTAPAILASAVVQAQAQTQPQADVAARAAKQTAQEAAVCRAAQPFYWEIGDGTGVLTAGQAGREGQTVPDAQTIMQIASASKWIYGAFVAERRAGRLTADDVAALNFTSGYTRFHLCRQRQTVQECQGSLLNGRGKPDADTLGRFYYNGGHMQQHAVQMGLGPLDNEGLAQAIRRELGPTGAAWSLSYSQPQLAGGGRSNAADYGRFLRALLKQELKMSGLLGAHAVCTQSKSCPGAALKTPIPATESWHYALGHWVEDDATVGDGAFSSPGAFGFYPWIDASKRYYGIVAREDHDHILLGDADSKPAIESVACGRLIRQAWITGQAQR